MDEEMFTEIKKCLPTYVPFFLFNSQIMLENLFFKFLVKRLGLRRENVLVAPVKNLQIRGCCNETLFI